MQQSPAQPTTEEQNAAHQHFEELNDVEQSSEEPIHWKEQHIKIQGLVNSLEQKVAALEMQNMELKTKLQTSLTTANAANSRRKRKQLDMVEASSPNKAAKQSQHPQASQAVQTVQTPFVNQATQTSQLPQPAFRTFDQATQTSQIPQPAFPTLQISLQDEAQIRKILDGVELHVQSTEGNPCYFLGGKV